MAIPIMKGSIVPQLNPVEVAEGRAVDASQQISSIFNDMSQFLSNRAEFEQRQKDRDDMMLAMQAENEYTNQMALLNSELSQKSGVALANSQEDYKKRAIALHDKYLQSISGISDSYIKEKSRAKINTFNTENKVRSDLAFYKNKNEMFLDSYRRNMEEDNENAASYITGNLDYDAVTLKNVVNKKINEISEVGVNQGWTKEQTRDEIQAQIGNFVKISAEKLATSQDFEQGGFEAYRPVLDYTKKAFEDGYLTHEQYAAISRPHEKHAVELETRMMAAEAYKKKKIPGYVSVLSDNGDVNKAFLERVKGFTPNLRPEERYKFIKDMAGISFANPNLSKEGQALVQQENDILYTEYVVNRLGFLQDGVYKSVFNLESQNSFDINEEETLELIKEGKITRGQVFAWYNSYKRALMQESILSNGEYVKSIGTQETQNKLHYAFSRINKLFAGALQGEKNFVPKGHIASRIDVITGIAFNALSGKYQEPRKILGVRWGTKQNQVQEIGKMLDFTHNLWEKYSDAELEGSWSSWSIDKQKEALAYLATNMVWANMATNPDYKNMLAEDKQRIAKEQINLLSVDMFNELQKMKEEAEKVEEVPVQLPVDPKVTHEYGFPALDLGFRPVVKTSRDFKQMGN